MGGYYFLLISDVFNTMKYRRSSLHDPEYMVSVSGLILGLMTWGKLGMTEINVRGQGCGKIK